MREATLRSVLIVKAIEETDGTEFLIPDAERKTAAREAQRDAGVSATADALNASDALPARAQRMLAARAAVLLPPVVARHPFIDSVSKLASGPRSLAWVLVGLSALCGGALSALDGPRRIDLLSLPLLGLIVWNLLVYAAVVAGWLLQSSSTRPRRRPLPGLTTRWVLRKARRFIDSSAQFNAPLAEALNRFIREWAEVAKPLLLARASRVFHLCAAAAGMGLIAGLYLRGITLDYRAGWESTFLDASTVHTLLSIIYAPASLAIGIAIPDAAHLAAIGWQDGRGGERAANWIHLLAASVALFVVLPRLGLVALGTIAVWRRSLSAALPPSLTAYFRKIFGGEGVLVRTAVVVIPYAYEPSAGTVAELRRLLTSAIGQNGSVDVRMPVRYGDEDTLLRSVGQRSDAPIHVIVLLLNLAATPEDENHGVVAASARQPVAATPPAPRVLIVLDEGPYGARMSGLGGPAERMAERRRLWQSFVEKRGSEAYFVNLAAPGAEGADESGEARRLRAALLHGGAA